MGALHAFHAGTVVGLRCYLEPLTCDERDWVAVESACREFEKISKVDGWSKLGEKATKVFGILLRKALEKKAILEGALGSSGITIGATGQGGFDNGVLGGGGGGFDANLGMPSYSIDTSSSGSTGYEYPSVPPLFGTPNQFDANPLTNPALHGGDYSPSRLMGAGMPGVVASDSSPDQANWDAFWPKGMNLVHHTPKFVTDRRRNGICFSRIWMWISVLIRLGTQGIQILHRRMESCMRNKRIRSPRQVTSLWNGILGMLRLGIECSREIGKYISDGSRLVLYKLFLNGMSVFRQDGV